VAEQSVQTVLFPTMFDKPRRVAVANGRAPQRTGSTI